MKRKLILSTSFLLVLYSNISNAQVTSILLASQSTPQTISPPNLVFVDKTPGSMNRLWVASTSSLVIDWSKLNNIPTIFPTNINNVSGLTSALNNKITIGSTIPYNTLSGAPALSAVALTGLYQSLSNLPILFSGSFLDLTNKPTYYPTNILNVSGLQSNLDNKVNIGQSIDYNILTNKPTIPDNQIQSDWVQSNINSLDYIKNKPTIPTNNNQLTNGQSYLNQSGVRSSINVVVTRSSGIANYNPSTGDIDIPNYTPSARVFNNSATKIINGTGVQLSTTRDVNVSYTITHNVALTLVLNNGSSIIYLEISSNNTTWTTISSAGFSRSLTIAVALNDSNITNVQGIVPSGYYIRLRSVVSGGGSVTYTNGQEVQQ